MRLTAEVSVEAAGEGGVDCRLNVQVTGGVAVGVEDVEVRANAVCTQSQLAAVLEGGAVLLVVGDCLGEVVAGGESRWFRSWRSCRRRLRAGRRCPEQRCR